MTEILSIPEPESVIDAADDVNTQTPIQNRYCLACSHIDGSSERVTAAKHRFFFFNWRHLTQSDSYSFWYHRRGNKSVSITNKKPTCSLLFVCIIQLPRIWKLILLRFLVSYEVAIKLRGKYEDYSKLPDSWAFLACLRPFNTPKWIQIHYRLPPFPRGKLLDSSKWQQQRYLRMIISELVDYFMVIYGLRVILFLVLRRLIRHTRLKSCFVFMSLP